MRNFKMTIEYDGSRYDGWQKQPGKSNRATVQEKIESVLSKMENEEITVTGAVRTESGVHAYEQAANFRSDTEMKPYEIRHYLNRFLPRDIAVLEVEEAPERFDSSFHIRSVVFEYKIVTGDTASVFDRKYSYYSFKKLDVARMREAAGYIKGKHDFKAFTDNRRMKKSTIRVIHDLDIYDDGKEILLTIHGDDFWPGMARIIAGTLIETGKGLLSPAQVKEAVEEGIREKAGTAAEPQGLFLQKIFWKETSL